MHGTDGPKGSPLNQNHDALVIPKQPVPVTLWVHPEGRVQAEVFLFRGGEQPGASEVPADLFNSESPFVVARSTETGETRFYNKRAIVRVEYDAGIDPRDPESGDLTQLGCRLSMMDGSILDGVIEAFMPPEHRRLYDYINLEGERFLRLRLDAGLECLVNKAYIVRIVQADT